MTGSSSSSLSNSSDSDFSLMRDTGVLQGTGAKLKSDSVTSAMPTLVNQVIHLKDRQQHCKDDAHHEKAHHHDEQGAEEAHHGGEYGIELPLLAHGGLLQHRIELAARFAARDEMNRHRREEPARG